MTAAGDPLIKLMDVQDKLQEEYLDLNKDNVKDYISQFNEEKEQSEKRRKPTAHVQISAIHHCINTMAGLVSDMNMLEVTKAHFHTSSKR